MLPGLLRGRARHQKGLILHRKRGVDTRRALRCGSRCRFAVGHHGLELGPGTP